MGLYRRVLSLSVIVLLLALPGIASAGTLQRQLSQYQQQYSQLNSEQKKEKQQADSTADRVTGLQLTRQNLNQLISREQGEVDETEKELQALNSKQQDLTRQKQAHSQELGAVLRTEYEVGSYGYLAFLFGASSWSDLFDRWDELSYIVNRYTQLQKEISGLSTAIAAQNVVVQKKAAELENSLQAEQATRQTVQESEGKEKTLMLQLNVQEKGTLEAKSKAQTNIDYIQGLIRQEQIDAQNAKNHPITGGSGGTTGSSIAQPVQLNGTVGDLISYAEGYTGVPYLWGGTTPQGFDCSGYVQYVFHHFGINLLRTSEEQYTEGIPVSRDDLEPGDIVFFSTYAPGASHDGIYVGNDTMIDAENRGVLVTRVFGSPYWGPRYLGARRVIEH